MQFVYILKRFRKEKPLNYELGEKQVPSQYLPDWYAVVCGLSIISREKAVKWKYVYGGRVYQYVVDHITAVDIDEPVDFIIAETLYKYKNFNGTSIRESMNRGGKRRNCRVKKKSKTHRCGHLLTESWEVA